MNCTSGGWTDGAKLQYISGGATSVASRRYSFGFARWGQLVAYRESTKRDTSLLGWALLGWDYLAGNNGYAPCGRASFTNPHDALRGNLP